MLFVTIMAFQEHATGGCHGPGSASTGAGLCQRLPLAV